MAGKCLYVLDNGTIHLILPHHKSSYGPAGTMANALEFFRFVPAEDEKPILYIHGEKVPGAAISGYTSKDVHELLKTKFGFRQPDFSKVFVCSCGSGRESISSSLSFVNLFSVTWENTEVIGLTDIVGSNKSSKPEFNQMELNSVYTPDNSLYQNDYYRGLVIVSTNGVSKLAGPFYLQKICGEPFESDPIKVLGRTEFIPGYGDLNTELGFVNNMPTQNKMLR